MCVSHNRDYVNAVAQPSYRCRVEEEVHFRRASHWSCNDRRVVISGVRPVHISTLSRAENANVLVVGLGVSLLCTPQDVYCTHKSVYTKRYIAINVRNTYI